MFKSGFKGTYYNNKHQTIRSKFSHQFPAGCTCSSQPLPLTRETSPATVEYPHLGSCPDASSCSHSPAGGLPVSSGGANVLRATVNFEWAHKLNLPWINSI